MFKMNICFDDFLDTIFVIILIIIVTTVLSLFLTANYIFLIFCIPSTCIVFSSNDSNDSELWAPFWVFMLVFNFITFCTANNLINSELNFIYMLLFHLIIFIFSVFKIIIILPFNIRDNFFESNGKYYSAWIIDGWKDEDNWKVYLMFYFLLFVEAIIITLIYFFKLKFYLYLLITGIVFAIVFFIVKKIRLKKTANKTPTH